MEWDEQEDGPYPDFFFPNGRYWGDMKDGLPNGRGEAVFHDGSRYLGFFEDGVFQSPWWIERFWNKDPKLNPFWSIPPFEPMHEQFESSDGGLYFGWFKDGLPDTSYPDSDYQPKYMQDAYIFQYNYWEEDECNPRFSSGWTFKGLVSEGSKDKGYFRPELGVDSVLRNLTCSENNDIAENIRLRWRDEYYGKWSGEEFQPRSMKKIWDFPTYLETSKGIGIEVKSNTCKLIKRLRERHLDCLGLSVSDRKLEDNSGWKFYPIARGINFAAVEKALSRSTDSVGEDPVDHYRELNKDSESQILFSLGYLGEIDWEADYEYRYRGEFKGLVPHGKGQLLFAGPYSYHGEFRDGKYHGEGLEKFHHGVTKGVVFGIPKHMGADEIMNLTEEAISGMNLDDFVPASIGDQRGTYRGQFVNGIREGKGVLKLDFDENNVPWKIFEGEFANGEPTVNGVWTYPGKEAMEKSAKEVAFRVSNKQHGAPEIDWTEKEECWQSNSGACVYCGKTCIEAPVSFWWEVYPKLTLVLSCVECAEKKFSNFDDDDIDPPS